MRMFRAAALCGVLSSFSCGEDIPVFPDAPTDADLTDANEPVGMLPSAIDLALADCGGSTSRTFNVVNNGNATLEYEMAMSDKNFTIMPSSGMIVAGASTTFTITATIPDDSIPGTALTATLTATTNLPGSPHSVPIRVTPSGALVTITPPSVGFGQVEAGTASPPETLAISNIGNAPAIVSISSPGGEFARIFGTTGTLTLGGGQSAQATFTYNPSGLGTDNGTALVAVTGQYCGTPPTTISLSGEGAITGGVLVQGTPVAFGTVACGSAGGSDTITLVNTTNLSVPFSTTFLTDPEGDQTRYTVTPGNGAIPPLGMTTLTITRLAIATPITPRAFDAVLRVTTTVPSAVNHDVAISQTLSGPFLAVTPASTDFGYASLGNNRTGTLSLQNTGTQAAVLQSTTAAPFALQLPSMVAMGATVGGTATFTPEALGTIAGNASITAAAACSSPVNLTFTAGNGPEIGRTTAGVSATCPVGATIAGTIGFTNTGNQDGTVTCVETSTTDLAPQFAPSPLTVGAGSAAILNVTVSTGTQIRAGATTAQLRCTTSEPVGNQHDFAFTRELDGVDLVLAAAAPLDFTCLDTDEQFYTLSSAATSTRSEFIMPTDNLVFPLGHIFTQQTLAPGAMMTNEVNTYGGGSAMAPQPVFRGAPGGLPDPCQGSGNPGDPAFTGTVGVNTGSSAVCSVTPATLPVILRFANPQ